MVKQKVKTGIMCPTCGGEIEAWAYGEDVDWSCPKECLYDDPDTLGEKVEEAFYKFYEDKTPAAHKSQPWPPPILPIFPPDVPKLGVEEMKVKDILNRLYVVERLAQRVSAKLNSTEYDPIRERPKQSHIFEVKLTLTIKKVQNLKDGTIDCSIAPEYEYGFDV